MNNPGMRENYAITSESVGEGHPDKVADYIADSVLDAHLVADPTARVACEVLCKDDTVILAGEITSRGSVDYEHVVQNALCELGYDDDSEGFSAGTVKVVMLISEQSGEISTAVSRDGVDFGAGDQGIVYGFAARETPELMPLPILLAHRITRSLSEDRKGGHIKWLRPDSKSQVTVRYAGVRPESIESVLVSTQHLEETRQDTIREYVRDDLLPRALGEWYGPWIKLLVNPSGSFVTGGPSADCGLTGRKIIVDTYGGVAHHGGGAFSGKDATKVDRAGAYFCRHVAREILKTGTCDKVEVSVAYAIGVPEPISVEVDTFGTGEPEQAAQIARAFDFRPAAIIEQLKLREPIYRQTTNFGHFGKQDLPWEV